MICDAFDFEIYDALDSFLQQRHQHNMKKKKEVRGHRRYAKEKYEEEQETKQCKARVN